MFQEGAVLTVRQVSERLGVSPALVYNLVALGKLRSYRVGNGRGVIRFSEEHISAYLSGAEPKAIPPTSSRPLRLRHLDLP